MSANETSSAVPNACPYCEKSHVGQCPKVRAIEYYPDGFTVRRIEFHREQREDR